MRFNFSSINNRIKSLKRSSSMASFSGSCVPSIPDTSGLQSEISELQSQREGLTQRLDELQNVVAKNQAQINERKNMLLPISTLYPEVLSMIFLFVVSFVPGDLQPIPYPMPLMLASVCRRWRSIMLANPRLWTHIILDHCRSYNLQSYISRSADLMLDISHFESGADCKGIQALLHTLSQEAHRWQKLQVNISDSGADNRVPLWTQKHAKSLQYIRMVADMQRYRPQDIFPAFPSHQDNLHTLILIRVHMLKELVAPNLQHLTFIGTLPIQWERKVSSESLWRTLSHTTKLQTLRLGIESITFGDSAKVKTLPLTHLQHFTIYFVSNPFDQKSIVLEKLLSMISAPALQVIEITRLEKDNRSDSYDTGVDRNIWVKLLSDGMPRYPTVTTARLYNVSDSTKDIRRFVDAFPNITSLSLDHRALTLCKRFLKEHDSREDPLYQCWKSLQCTRVHLPLENFGDSDLYKWCELRRERSLPPSSLQVVLNRGLPTESGDLLTISGQIRVVATADNYLDRDAPWDMFNST